MFRQFVGMMAIIPLLAIFCSKIENTTKASPAISTVDLIGIFCLLVWLLGSTSHKLVMLAAGAAFPISLTLAYTSLWVIAFLLSAEDSSVWKVVEMNSYDLCLLILIYGWPVIDIVNSLLGSEDRRIIP